ncbi:tRNA nucleotidyltransferase [Microbacterium phage Cece]|nr:tRNA nucleotidyltransferase [Microbacterium phage Cece]
MTDIQMYLVGGAVRDELLGLPSKDLDYTVTVDGVGTVEDAWDAMRDHLSSEGFHIFLETPEYQTIRAKFPKGHEHEKITADFVLARKEGPYSDGRRPDWVKPGTLEDDLRRRDFTVNALAKAEDGTIIDLFGGQDDLSRMILRAVGDPKDRLLEDPLRAYRALRFAITKGFKIDYLLRVAMRTVSILDKMESSVAAERIKDELHRAFAHDPTGTILMLANEYPYLLGIMERKGIWLRPTLEKRK